MKLFKSFCIALILVGCAPEVGTGTPATSTTGPPPTTSSTSTTVPKTTTTTTAPSGSCTPVPSGGDDTAAVAAILNACSIVSITQPLRIDKQIIVTTSNKTITWSGAGQLYRTLPAPDGSGLAMLRFTGSSNVTLNNPQIHGPNTRRSYTSSKPLCGYFTPLENQHLLAIRGVNNFTTNGGKLWEGNGDGVYIDGASNGVTLNNLTVDCVGRTAVTNLGSTNTRINGGTFTDTIWWIFNIELQGEVVNNYYIDHPVVGYSRLVFLLASCPYGGTYSNVTINKPTFMADARQDYTARCGPVTVIY